MTLHLTSKNCFIWIAGVCVVLLAAIAVLVPSDHWGLTPWKWIILALVGLALIGLTLQLFMQSREDHGRDLRDGRIAAQQQGIETRLTEVTQLIARGADFSSGQETAITTQPMNPPVDFNASKHFLTAWQSALTADVEQRIKIAATQNRSLFSPEDFYSKFIGIGVVAYMHDLTWAISGKARS